MGVARTKIGPFCIHDLSSGFGGEDAPNKHQTNTGAGKHFRNPSGIMTFVPEPKSILIARAQGISTEKNVRIAVVVSNNRNDSNQSNHSMHGKRGHHVSCNHTTHTNHSYNGAALRCGGGSWCRPQ